MKQEYPLFSIQKNETVVIGKLIVEAQDIDNEILSTYLKSIIEGQ